MSHFGQQLRQERESRGIPLESITGVTKISGRHLLALEQEDFAALPGGVLSKGIVRGYARVVGLAEEEWVGRYLTAYQQSGQVKDDDVSWTEFAENVGRARKGELARAGQGIRWAGVAVFLCLVLAFGWFVAHYVQTRSALAAEDLRPRVAAMPAPPPEPARPARHAHHLQTPQAALPSDAPPLAAPAATAPSPEPGTDSGVAQPAGAPGTN